MEVDQFRVLVDTGQWRGDDREIFPVKFAPEYKPRSRFVTPDELKLILPHLSADHAAAVAFMVATSAEWGAVERAQRDDISLETRRVFLRGTKRSTRERYAPLITEIQRSLIHYVLEHAQGVDGALFRSWGNVRRDLVAACDEAKIPRCSPNDLRRTCATWLREAGAPPDLIAPLMGHADTRMVERVYGRLPIELLEKRLAEATGSIYLHTGVTNGDEITALPAPSAKALNEKPRKKRGGAVPRDRIELPTRGFSILKGNGGSTRSDRWLRLIRGGV